MKEADKRARITVAYGGLDLLQSNYRKDNSHSVPRSALFALPKGDNDSLLIKAIRTKSWQKPYVQRLVDAEILIKLKADGQEMYQPKDSTSIPALLQDHDNFGLRLSRFLFPNEAGIPKELQDDEEEIEEDTDESGVLDRPAAGDYVPSKDFYEHNKFVGNYALMTVDAIKILDRKISELNESTKAIPIKHTPSQVETELLPYIRNRMKDIDIRFKALEDRVGTLQASQTKTVNLLARIDGSVQKLFLHTEKLVGSINQPSSVELIKEVTTAIRSSLGFSDLPESATLASYMREALAKFKGDTTLRETLAELRSRLQDMNALEELTIKAIEASEGQHE